MKLTINLASDVLPISKAASSLAALIKRARATSRPIIVTQKGYPTGVLLSIPLFVELQRRAQIDPDRLLTGWVPEAEEASAADVTAFLEGKVGA